MCVMARAMCMRQPAGVLCPARVAAVARPPDARHARRRGLHRRVQAGACVGRAKKCSARTDALCTGAGAGARARGRMTVRTRASSKASAKPPEKGSFPLDHFHECKTFMEKYMACLKREANAHASCREETKACAPLPSAPGRTSVPALCPPGSLPPACTAAKDRHGQGRRHAALLLRAACDARSHPCPTALSRPGTCNAG